MASRAALGSQAGAVEDGGGALSRQLRRRAVRASRARIVSGVASGTSASSNCRSGVLLPSSPCRPAAQLDDAHVARLRRVRSSSASRRDLPRPGAADDRAPATARHRPIGSPPRSAWTAPVGPTDEGNGWHLSNCGELDESPCVEPAKALELERAKLLVTSQRWRSPRGLSARPGSARRRRTAGDAQRY